MARLPSAIDLSRAASLRSGRAIAAADTSAIGRGVESFGSSLRQAGADLEQQQNAVDLARAEAYKTQEFIAAQNEFAHDPDYTTVGERATARTGEIVKTASELIRNQGLRQRWELGAGTDAAQVNDSIYDRGVNLQREAETVAFDEALEANRRIYVDPATPEAIRQKARADIEGALQMGAASGLLSPGDAATRTTQYLENADYDLGLLLVEQGGFDGGLPSAGDAPSLLRSFEGYRETPYNDPRTDAAGNQVGADIYRVGYGSDTITREDGSVVKVTPGMTVTREDAERDLARRTKEFEATAIGQVGPDAWAALPAPARAALTSVTYNYGSLPDSVVAAVKVGDIAAISNAVAGLQDHNGGVNKDRRLKEAAIIAGQGNPDWYERLSPEQRQVIDDRSTAHQQSVATAAAAQQKVAYEQHKGTVQLGIKTGAIVSEQELLSDPVLDDGDIATLIGTLRSEQQSMGAANQYVTAMANGTATPINPYNADQRALGEKAYEVQQSGLAEEDRAAGAMSFISDTGYVPKSVVANVRLGLSSTDPQVVAGAMAQSVAIESAAPQALAAIENGSEIAKAADLAKVYNNMGYTAEQAAQKVIDANDPESIRQREALLKSKPVVDLLKSVSDRTISSLFPSFPGTSFAVGSNPEQTALMVTEYKSMLEEALVDTGGDPGAANELVKTRFTRRYGPSDMMLSGGWTISRLPPEKTYPPLPDGSHTYVMDQLKEALTQDGVEFEDVRVETFEDTDADAFSGQPARYLVYIKAPGAPAHELFPVPYVADYSAALEAYEAGRTTALQEAEARRAANAAAEEAVIEAPPGSEAWYDLMEGRFGADANGAP